MKGDAHGNQQKMTKPAARFSKVQLIFYLCSLKPTSFLFWFSQQAADASDKALYKATSCLAPNCHRVSGSVIFPGHVLPCGPSLSYLLTP